MIRGRSKTGGVNPRDDGPGWPAKLLGARFFFVGIGVFGGPLLALGAGNMSAPLSPQEALQSFQLEPGLELSLVAAEPLVSSPVAFTFDERGRLYVVENRGYPDFEGKVTTEGRIALLEDTDGDGRYDKRTEFAAGLTYPNGICLWRGGVFVTCAPDIYYLKDTNGDGVADERRVVLTGFASTKTAQIRVSHPTLGPDGKIYVTSGLNTGKVLSPEHPERPAVEFTPSDSRFDPDTLAFETTGGRGQFGLAIDDFGRRFNCTNRSPLLSVMLEPWQLKRNPSLAFGAMVQEVSKIDYEAKVAPISQTTVTAAYIPSLMNAPHSGTFTSACGIALFRGTGLGEGFEGNAFVCEPAQNLVQRQIVRPEGASFRSTVPHPEHEFLASTDGWFRPVFAGQGPGGALYLADMYRREIDHPQYVPEEMRGSLDFAGGRDRGRIYRIAARRSASPAAPVVFSATSECLARLDSAEGWERDTAFRRLLERRDPAAVAPLAAVAKEGRRPESRARALWLLRNFGQLEPAQILRAVGDADARVRENAVELAAGFVPSTPELRAAVLATARDPDARVRFVAARELSGVAGAEGIAALVAIAVRDGSDRWTRAAVLSSLRTEFVSFFEDFRHRTDAPPEAYAAMMNDLGKLFGAAGSTEVCRKMLLDLVVVETDAQVSSRLPAVLGLADGLRGRKKGRDDDGTLRGLLAGAEPAPVAARAAFARFLRVAAALALDERRSLGERKAAISLLGNVEFESLVEVLGKLLRSDNSPDLQLAAISAIERANTLPGAALLVEAGRWATYTPKVREAVLGVLSSNRNYLAVLFSAIERKIVPASAVSSVRRSQLLRHKEEAIRAQAEKIFRELEGGDRMQVYQGLKAVLSLPAKAERGREVFVKSCSACHSYAGAGGRVGPELTAIQNQPAEAILLHVIVPNYEIAAGYQTFSVETKDGRQLSGWLAGETDASVSLRTVGEGETTILRTEIQSMTAASVSLMPDGLEQAMTRPELADLIAYLKAGR